MEVRRCFTSPLSFHRQSGRIPIPQGLLWLRRLHRFKLLLPLLQRSKPLLCLSRRFRLPVHQLGITRSSQLNRSPRSRPPRRGGGRGRRASRQRSSPLLLHPSQCHHQKNSRHRRSHNNSSNNMNTQIQYRLCHQPHHRRQSRSQTAKRFGKDSKLYA